ncbi:hypothetical protein NSX50_22525, partial [Salmonella enterica]|nr:hypothetical protein [Salmonella enterica]MCR2278232.1 hypothetical protein [Salmonella enterica]MCR2287265.1 hypothetical protein [Salmonella enterica]
EWVHVQLHQQKGMISLSPPTICNSATFIHNMNIVVVTDSRESKSTEGDADEYSFRKNSIR